jgi:hypothetical protein
MDTNYHIGLSVRPHWYVGYHPEKDEMFIYKIDDDQLVHVFCRGGLDSIGFYEFMDFSKAELLGEL